MRTLLIMDWKTEALRRRGEQDKEGENEGKAYLVSVCGKV